MSNARCCDELLPCPFCGGEMMFRDALWPSEGDTQSITHKSPTESCGIIDFSLGTCDGIVIEAWNRRATHAGTRQVLTDKPWDSLLKWMIGPAETKLYRYMQMRKELLSASPQSGAGTKVRGYLGTDATGNVDDADRDAPSQPAGEGLVERLIKQAEGIEKWCGYVGCPPELLREAAAEIERPRSAGAAGSRDDRDGVIEECARVCDMSMDALLLRCGEMSLAERRLVKALSDSFANQIRALRSERSKGETK